MDLSAELFGVLSKKIAEITALATAVERFLKAFDVPDHTIFQINVAIEELITNTINYGYRGNDESLIRINLKMENQEIVIRIVDEATPFNPFAQAPVDTTGGIDQRRIGGLGIHLVKEMIDHVDYQRVDGRNHVTLRQTFTPAGECVANEEAQ
jgi:serine/threonine-protein kinase RsbW